MTHQTTAVITRLASRRHGVVTRAQLLRAGVAKHEIRHRLDTGWLLHEHRGVYRVGHRAPSLEAAYLAAALACGDGARVSGPAAAHLYGLTKGKAPSPEVSAPRKRRVEGVRVRRAAIGPLDRATDRAIPITTVPRRRAPKVPGARNLRRITDGDARVTLSALERRFLQILRENRLPLPRTNRPAGTYRVDCRWPDRRLTVELDSYHFHHSRHAWEQDRRRDREARARGDELRRYTWGDMFEEPAKMLAELRAALSPAGPESCPAVELSWDACARAPHQ